MTRLGLICGVAAALCSRPSLGRDVIVGITPIDADTTTLEVIDLDTATLAPRRVGELHHRRGYAPVGIVIDDHTVAAVVEIGNEGDALVVKKDLRTQTETPLLDEAVPGQRPLWEPRADGGRELLVVRQRHQQVKGGDFAVVGVDLATHQSTILATAPRLWVTPCVGPSHGADPAFLVVDGASGFQGLAPTFPRAVKSPTGDGVAHVDVVHGGRFIVRHELGPGSFRTPRRHGSRVVLERSRSATQAELIELETGKVLVVGRPDLSPVFSPRGVLAVSSSRKDGSVRVQHTQGGWTSVPGSRAGIARPQLVVDDSDEIVVVAWVDRGASLPGELWRLGPDARRLLPPAPRTAVTVWGVVPEAVSSSLPSSSSRMTPSKEP
jgi:hypothetical protein